MNRLLAALVVAAPYAFSAQAQTPPSAETQPPLTLSRALDLAGASAPALEAASAGLRAAEAARTIAGLRPNPTINIEAENVAGTGPYSGTQSMEATTSLQLPIELGGKRSARVAVADAQRDRAGIERAIAQADLRFAVTRAYAEAAASERRLVNAREQFRIANEGLRAADVRVRAGRASPLEVQRADVTRINAAAALERSERSAEVARFTLSQRIGQTILAPLAAPGSIASTADMDRCGPLMLPVHSRWLRPMPTLPRQPPKCALHARSASQISRWVQALAVSRRRMTPQRSSACRCRFLSSTAARQRSSKRVQSNCAPKHKSG